MAGATWYEHDYYDHDATSQNDWAVVGGDFDPTVLDTQSLGSGQWISLDVTDAVRAHIFEVSDNNGLAIVPADEAGGANDARFYSSEYTTDTALRPKLVITYTEGDPNPPPPPPELPENRLVLQQSLDGYTGCTDTSLSGTHPTMNTGRSRDLYTWRGSTVDNPRKDKNAVVKFDLSTVPADKYIVQAKLEVYCHALAYPSAEPKASVKTVTRSWVEGEGHNQAGVPGATWYEHDYFDHDATAQNDWTVRGGEFGASVLDSQPIVVDQWLSFDVTATVRAMKAETQDNHGFGIVPFDEGSGVNSASYYSSEYNFNASLRPKLVLVLAEEEELSFQEGDGEDYSNTENAYIENAFPTVPHNSSLVAGKSGTTIKCALVRFPDAIGHAMEQIPHDAIITEAKLTLTNTFAKNQPISAYRVTDGWTYESIVPTWSRRRLAFTNWTVEGCGYTDENTKSRTNTIEDTVTCTQGYTAYDWDITAAVQAWVNDANLNKGLILENRSATDLQVFYSSDEKQFPAYRPVLTVKFYRADIQAPKLAIASSLTSNTKKAFIEGTKDPEVDTISLSADGEPVDVVVTNSTTWHAFVERGESSTVALVASSEDAEGNQTQVSETLTFVPLEAGSDDGLMMQVGDAALVTIPSTHQDAASVRFDPGKVEFPVVGDVAETLVVTFEEPGEFECLAEVLDEDGKVLETHEMNITVVRVTMKPGLNLGIIVSQFYNPTTYYEVQVEPASAAELVYLATEDEDLLTVKPRATTETGVKSEIVLEKVSSPQLQARLGGITGRVLDRDGIQGFKLDCSGFFGRLPDRDGRATVTMRPLIPGMLVSAQLGFGSTYPDGSTTRDFWTEDLTPDGEGGGSYVLDCILGETASHFEVTLRTKQARSEMQEIGAFYMNRPAVLMGFTTRTFTVDDIDDDAYVWGLQSEGHGKRVRMKSWQEGYNRVTLTLHNGDDLLSGTMQSENVEIPQETGWWDCPRRKDGKVLNDPASDWTFHPWQSSTETADYPPVTIPTTLGVGSYDAWVTGWYKDKYDRKAYYVDGAEYPDIRQGETAEDALKRHKVLFEGVVVVNPDPESLNIRMDIDGDGTFTAKDDQLEYASDDPTDPDDPDAPGGWVPQNDDNDNGGIDGSKCPIADCDIDPPEAIENEDDLRKMTLTLGDGQGGTGTVVELSISEVGALAFWKSSDRTGPVTLDTNGKISWTLPSETWTGIEQNGLWVEGLKEGAGVKVVLKHTVGASTRQDTIKLLVIGDHNEGATGASRGRYGPLEPITGVTSTRGVVNLTTGNLQFSLPLTRIRGGQLPFNVWASYSSRTELAGWLGADSKWRLNYECRVYRTGSGIWLVDGDGAKVWFPAESDAKGEKFKAAEREGRDERIEIVGKGDDKHYELVRHSMLRYHFDYENGRLEKMVDLFENAVEITYEDDSDNKYKITKITEKPNGASKFREIELDWSTPNSVTVTDPADNAVALSTTGVSGSSAEVWGFTVDSEHHYITTLTNSLDKAWTVTSSDRGCTWKIDRPQPGTEEETAKVVEWDIGGGEATVKDWAVDEEERAQITYYFEEKRNVWTSFVQVKSDEATRTASRGYPTGKPLRRLDSETPFGQSQSASWEYDERLNIKTATDVVAGMVWEYKYNDFNQGTYTKDPMGRVSSSKYREKDGALLESRGPGDSHPTSYETDVRGRISKVTTPRGAETKYTFDDGDTNNAGSGLVKQITLLAGSQSTTRTLTRDILGRLDEEERFGTFTQGQDTKHYKRYYVYDDRSNLKESIGPTTFQTKATAAGEPIRRGWQYDANDNLTYFWDESRSADIFDTSKYTAKNEYDVLDRLVKTTNALGEVTERKLDERGNAVEIKEPCNAWVGGEQVTQRTTKRVFNLVDQLIETKPPGYNPAQGYGNIVNTFDSREYLQSVVDERGKTWEQEVDNAGRITKWIDPEHNETSRQLNADDTVASVTDGAGRTLANTFNPRGQLGTKTIAAIGATTKLNYEPLEGSFSGTEDPIGATSQRKTSPLYWPDESRYGSTTDGAKPSAAKFTDHRGDGLPAKYKVYQQAVRQGSSGELNDLFALIVDLVRNGRGQILKRTVNDSRGGISGGAYQENYFDAVVEETEYEPDGLLKKHTIGNTQTTIGRDLLRRETSWETKNLLTGQVISKSSRIFNPGGTVASETDAKDRVTTYKYDLLDRLIERNDPGVTTPWKYEYDWASNLAKETNPAGEETRYVYDDAGRRTKTIRVLDPSDPYNPAKNPVWTTEYNGAGQIAATVDPRGKRTTMDYDDGGRRVKLTDPLGHTVTYGHNAAGDRTSVTDENGRTTVYTYYGNHLLKSVTDAGGRTVFFTYDGAGNRRTKQVLGGPVSAITWYTYNLSGQVRKVVYPGGITHKFDYDTENRLLWKQDAANQEFVFEYTTAAGGGRKVIKNYLPKTGADYDAKTLTSIHNIDGTLASVLGKVWVGAQESTWTDLSYAYSASRGFLTGATDNILAQSVTYTQDLVGRRKTVTGGGVTRTSVYDAIGRRSALVNGTNPADDPKVVYGYDLASRRTSMQLPNGITASYTFNNADHLTGVSYSKLVDEEPVTVESATYAVDDAGRRQSVTYMGGGKAAYTYDASYRLTCEEHTGFTAGNHKLEYAYDALSRRTQVKVDNGAETWNYAYRVGSPYLLKTVTEAGGQDWREYFYDENGDMVGLDVGQGGQVVEDWTYEYSPDRFVNKVLLGDETKREYERQGDSYMIRRDFTAGNEKRYVRDGDSVLVELNDSNQVTATYFGGGMDKMLSETRGGVTKWNLAGPNGSVMAVADVSGDVVSRYRYDAFGKRNAASSGIDPVAGQRTFQGRPHDEGLGLTNFRNRWYDPETGRFAQWDKVEDGGSWGNPFNFAGCDPVNNGDPMGDIIKVAGKIWSKKRLEEYIAAKSLSGDVAGQLRTMQAMRDKTFEATQPGFDAVVRSDARTLRILRRRDPRYFKQFAEALLRPEPGNKPTGLQLSYAKAYALMLTQDPEFTELETGGQAAAKLGIMNAKKRRLDWLAARNMRPGQLEQIERDIGARQAIIKAGFVYMVAGVAAPFVPAAASAGGVLAVKAKVLGVAVGAKVAPLVPLVGRYGGRAARFAATKGQRTAQSALRAWHAGGGRLSQLLGRNPEGVRRTMRAVRLGRAGESASGMTGPREAIRTVLGTATRRFPDRFFRYARILGETKNVKRLSFTRQLRDYAAFAEQERFTFELFVRRNTQMTKPLIKAVVEGRIELKVLEGL